MRRHTISRSPYLTQLSFNCNLLPYGSAVLHGSLSASYNFFSLCPFCHWFFIRSLSLSGSFLINFFSMLVFRFACNWPVYLLRSALKRQHPYSWVVRKHCKVHGQFSLIWLTLKGGKFIKGRNT